MENTPTYDVVLIGAGIMSATLGTLLHELDPTLSIAIYESTESIASESSNVENNAGTGHSAFCELNYTPDNAHNIDIHKAVAIAESYELSRQFWASLVERGYFADPKTFINSVPHCSLVFGEKDVSFLKRRHQALRDSPLFDAMLYTEDHAQLRQWMPLVMHDRSANDRLAATFMHLGTDVNFADLTKGLITHITTGEQVTISLEHQVTQLRQETTGKRTLSVYDRAHHVTKTVRAGFVFIGAGGGAISLLQKSGIAERKGLGGFPVSGQRLICNNKEIIEKHTAKVYGKVALGAPPMSVPHLDTRIINGKKALLFGPYAGFTTKFLKQGSFFDLPMSIKWHNVSTMIGAGLHNIPLTKYLIEQVMQTPEDRLNTLRAFISDAHKEDRDLKEAGYRVQIMKPDKKQGGMIQFGTEVIVSHDATLATLLGASPGASTAVDIMLRIITQCFPHYMTNTEAIKSLIPSYGEHLHENKPLLLSLRQRTQQVLGA